jgi:hypothetical protein
MLNVLGQINVRYNIIQKNTSAMFSWFIDNFERITQSIYRAQEIGQTKYEPQKKVTCAERKN